MAPVHFVFCCPNLHNYADGAQGENSVLIISNIGEWVAHVNNNLICARIVIDITADLIKTTWTAQNRPANNIPKLILL